MRYVLAILALLAALTSAAPSPPSAPDLPPKPTWDATRTPAAPTMIVGTTLPGVGILPPQLTYVAPGRVVVAWTIGDCAWKSYGNNGIWLGCSGRAELPGPAPIDAAVVPREGDRVWVVGTGGERSGVVVIRARWWALLPVVRHGKAPGG